MDMDSEPAVGAFARLRWEDHKPVDYELMRSDSYRYLNEAREALMPQFLDPSTGEFRADLVREGRCLLCQRSSFEELFWKEGLRFVRCRECDLIQVNPVPVEEVAETFYQSETYDRIMKMHTVDLSAYRRQRFGTERVVAWEALLGRPSAEKPMSVLDVGCADGFVLEAAQEQGWRAYGVDLNPAAVQAAQRKGLNVKLGKLEECFFDEEPSFDVVTMYDLLEHTYHPMTLLVRAYELLKPGGLLVLYVPNWNSLARLVLGTDLFFIWGIFHLSYFTPATLSRAVVWAGFEVVRMETQGMDIADLIWREENRGQGRSMAYLRDYREEFQFIVNASGWASNLRLFARKPGA